MNPARLLSGLFARWLSLASAVLFLHGCDYAPAQLPPLLPSRVRHTNWFSVVATDAAGATAESNRRESTAAPAFLEWLPAESPAPITNYALRITRTNADGRSFTRTLNLGTNTVAVWPPPSWQLTNCVVTVCTATATAASLAGPWETNNAILFCATNPPGMQFFRQVGLSITITNF